MVHQQMIAPNVYEAEALSAKVVFWEIRLKEEHRLNGRGHARQERAGELRASR